MTTPTDTVHRNLTITQRATCYFLTSLACLTSTVFSAGDSSSRLSDEPIPLQTEGFPDRPGPYIELGENPFLGTGYIGPGFQVPTGATWQPLFIVYGQYRSALQTFDDGRGGGNITEWSNRLDLFGNLYLTPTERINIGFRPLDHNGEFSGYRFDNDSADDDWVNRTDANIQTLFFEGDFGEMFPNLDPEDVASLDYGFAVGRQPLLLQDGLLINDEVDSIGVARTSLFYFGSSAFRVTGLYGWGQINRGNNRLDQNAQLVGISTSADYDKSTIDFDSVYVFSDDVDGDQLNMGLSLIRRFGHLNTTLRANTSIVVDEPGATAPPGAVDDGTVLLAQLSLTPPYTHDIAYSNIFVGIDRFRSAARSPATGGPLGNVGILFAAAGNGRYGAPLGNTTDNAYGAALGYQKFFNAGRQQLILEVGGRRQYDDVQSDGVAVGARYQHALGQHFIIAFDVFSAHIETRDHSYGARSELTVKF